MKITYQGKGTETGTDTVAAFLTTQGVKPAEAVVEYNGDILSGEAALATSLEDGAELNVFRIVAGGLRMWKCESARMWKCENVKIWEYENGREYLFD